MIIQNNDDNCCILEFKCTKTRSLSCTCYKNNGKNSKCVSEYKNYCFNLNAQRELILEILYPDEVETTRLINTKDDLQKKRKKELSLIEVNKI